MATSLTINLRKKLVAIHSTRRRKQAMRYLRAEVARHAKVDPEDVSIGMDVNEYMIRNVAIHLRPVQVSLDKTGGEVKVTLSDSLKNWRKTYTPAAQPTAKPVATAAKPGAKPAPAAKEQPKKQDAKKPAAAPKKQEQKDKGQV